MIKYFIYPLIILCLNGNDKKVAHQNYFEYINYYDAYFEKEFEKNPKDTVLLKKYKKYRRQRWFWDRRIDTKGSIDAYGKSLAKITDSLLRKENNGVVSESAVSNDWIPIDTTMPLEGPENDSGFPFTRATGKGQVHAVWVDPDNGNHVLIGNLGGGVFQTFNALATDGKVHWEPLTDNIPARGIFEIEKKNNVIYASCGFDMLGMFSSFRQKNNSFGVGMIRSYDNGKTWQTSDFTNNTEIPNGFTGKGFSVAENGLIYAVDKTSVFKSIDDGEHWTRLKDFSHFFTNRTVGLKDIYSAPFNRNIIWLSYYAIETNAQQVIMSNDGGKTWRNEYNTILQLIPEDQKINTIERVFLSENNGDLIMATYDKSRRLSLFKSTDYQNFKYMQTTPNLGMVHIDGFQKLNEEELIIYGMPFAKKLNLATQKLSNFTYNKMHDDVRCFTASNGVMYAGNDGGISISTDQGENWKDITGDFIGYLIKGLGYYSDNEGRLYDIACQDTGWYRNEMNGTPMFWIRGHEGGVYTSPTDKNRIYFLASRLSIYSSSSKVSKEETIKKKIKARHWASTKVMEDPFDPSILYTAPDFFMAVNSEYGNGSIHNLFHPIDLESKIGRVSSFDFCINGSQNVVYNQMVWQKNLGESDEGWRNLIWVSNDTGKNWKPCKVDDTFDKVQGLTVSDVTFNAYNPNEIWLSVGNISAGKKVYHSTDNGNSWKNISYNFPNMPVNAIDYDENRNRLLIATDIGVYFLNENTQTWQEFGNHLPKGIVNRMYIDDLYNKLVVSLCGRGVWEIDLEDAKDRLIQKNEKWNGENTEIAGDIIVRPNVTLEIENSHIKVNNIVLMKGAHLVLSQSNLASNYNTKKSYIIIPPGAYFEEKGRKNNKINFAITQW